MREDEDSDLGNAPVLPIPWAASAMSEHYRRVRKFMQAVGQNCPDTPRMPTVSERCNRARIQMEEEIETHHAAAVSIKVPCYVPELGRTIFVDIAADPKLTGWRFGPADHEPNLVDLVDGLIDNSVVNSGYLITCGVRDAPLLQLVDENNQLKVEKGYINEHGKLVKPKDHPKPDIAKALREQGWEG